MEKVKTSELSIFDYLPKVLPVLDVVFIIWVAITSPDRWITTPIHIMLPIVGFTSIKLFRDKGQFGVYAIGILTSIPIFFLNLWGSPDCPTWLGGIAFLVGGMMMAKNLLDQIVVISMGLCSTVIPLFINLNSVNFIITVCLTLCSVWFLIGCFTKFTEMQKKLIEEQKRIVEDKQKGIIDSIRYARRIQRSLLPTEKYLDKQLNQLNKKK